jgi:iron(III) transport system ATP-binding protein
VSALQIRGLTATYGGPEVLRGIDLDVADGYLACLIGPSGSGKSTLLRCVAGLHPTVSGRVVADDRVLDGLRPERRQIGLVPQDAALFTHLDVERNVGYGLFRLGRRERRARVSELLGLTGLSELAHRMPYELSGGQQQRVALARALAPRPGLLLLDEPFSGLDPQLRADLREQVRVVLSQLRTTALLVSHDRDEALSLADEVVVLRDGEVRQTGRPAEVYRRPADVWTGRFVGEAVVLAGVAEHHSVSCSLGTLSADTAHSGQVRSGQVRSGQVQVLLRPEQIHLRRGDGVPDGPLVTVTGRAYRGRDWRIQAVTDAGEPVTAWWADVVGGGDDDVPEVGDRLAAVVQGAAVAYPG